jgi:hypothetical protein
MFDLILLNYHLSTPCPLHSRPIKPSNQDAKSRLQNLKRCSHILGVTGMGSGSLVVTCKEKHHVSRLTQNEERVDIIEVCLMMMRGEP